VTKNRVVAINLSKKPLINIQKTSYLYSLPQVQRGTVLMEFVVIVGLVLVPLFIGLTFIGKYIDNAQKIEVAARYSAWERTAWYQNYLSHSKKRIKILILKKVQKN